MRDDPPGDADTVEQPDDDPAAPDDPLGLTDDGAERRVFDVRRDVRKRLDVYIQERLKGVSRSRVQKLVQHGGVTVNGEPRKASTLVLTGDRIEVILPPPAVRTIEPEPIPLHILYEDDHLIVLNKQADLIIHPARGNLSGTLVNAMAHHLRQPRAEPAIDGLSAVGADDLRPGIVHRLDRFTTGVMVVAKRDEAHWGLARQFEQRRTLKAYLALAHGGPAQPGGVIDHPIGKHPTIREAMAVRHDSAGKTATTIYRVRRRYRGYSLIELELRTGRTHQIRVHLSYLGYPIVGDVIYGGEPVGESELVDPPVAAGSRQLLNFARSRAEGERIGTRGQQRDDLLMTTPALHAALLEFHHPISGERMRFTAPVHETMRRLLDRLTQTDGPLDDGGGHVDLAAALARSPNE